MSLKSRNDPHQRHCNPRLCDDKILLMSIKRVSRRILRLQDPRAICSTRSPTREVQGKEGVGKTGMDLDHSVQQEKGLRH